MQDDATLRDALIELDNLRRRDERIRLESETLQEALRLLVTHKPGRETLIGIFEGICRVTSSERGILISHGNGHPDVIGRYGDDLITLGWDRLPLFDMLDVDDDRCFFDLHRVVAWSEEFRLALPDFRSALYGRVLTEGKSHSVLLLREGKSRYTTKVADLFRRHLSLLKQAAAQSEAVIRQTELERELHEAQKLEAVGQLAGGIAHEINTPAQYIGDNLKFLSDAHLDLFSLVEKCLALTEAVRGNDAFSTMVEDVDAVRDRIDIEYLREEVPSATEQSLSGIGQVSRIVLAMKEFSHPGTKEMSLADINRALKNTLTISRNEWKHVAEATTTFDENLPAVPCLAGELNQVFLNLIINAAHAIRDKYDGHGMGRIHISTGTDGDHVVVRIEDDGTGIPEGARTQVFNPFFTTKEVGHGTGQGLAIARDIVVKKHGGRIFFDTEAGEGTTFTVRLPIRLTPSARTAFPVADDGGGARGTAS